MKMPRFLTSERVNRALVSGLLCLGVLWPMLMAFGLDSAMVNASLAALMALALLIALSGTRKMRIIVWALIGAAVALQFFLPRLGFFGGSLEALKAISLYFNGVTSAAPLFAKQIALLLALVSALAAYSFSSRSVGYLPATVLVVIVLFGLWSLGKHTFLWYAAPALAALLLLIAQTSHERANLPQALPMAALLVALGLMIVPAGKTVIEPLYQAAMNLKQTITDYLFFTEPRNVFTLGSYGYYPMGGSRLGGEAEPSPYPVLTVKTDEKTLLRGVTKDEYTGRSWRDTSSGRRYLYVNPRWLNMRKNAFLEDMPAESVLKASDALNQKAVSVQVQNNIASTVFTPVFLRSVTTYGSMVPYFNEASELFITRDLDAGDRYTVYVPVFEGGDGALGALINAAPKKDAHVDKVREQYLGLPQHMEQRVYDDVRNIIASAATPYDQACAIQRHLQRYYRYSLTPVTPPENQDFVTYFLYVGKEGYCTYFASAMTVLCRMAGLPARYVEGFLAQPDASGFAYLTGKSAHAWTEVYFEGFGWVPFDPTPAEENLDQRDQDQPSPSPSPSPSPPPPEDDQQPDDQPTPSPEHPEESPEPDEDTPDTPPEEPPFPWWWLLLIAAAVIGAGARVALRMPDAMAKKQKTPQDAIFIYGAAAYTVMRLNKRTPRSGETPLLFARRMDRQHAFPTAVLPLWRMLVLSNYSRVLPGPEQGKKAREIFHALYKPQSILKKLRFMLIVGFTGKCYHSLETKVEPQQPVSPYGQFNSPNARPGRKGGKKNKRQKPPSGKTSGGKPKAKPPKTGRKKPGSRA